MAFDNSSSAKRKRKLAKKIQQNVRKQQAWYRAQRRKQEEVAMRPKEPQGPGLRAFNFSPTEIDRILNLAKQLRDEV